MILVYIFFVVCTLFFIPIRLKFNILYSKNNYYLKFYNINLYSKDAGLIRKFLNRKNTSNNSTISENTKSTNDKSKIKPSTADLITLIKKINNNKFKPKLKLDYTFNYSLSNASTTALLFGVIWNINTIFYNLISIIFYVKHMKPNIKPLFNNESSIEFTISCIISFNLAKIIYMLFQILQSKNHWEVIPA